MYKLKIIKDQNTFTLDCIWRWKRSKLRKEEKIRKLIVINIDKIISNGLYFQHN